MELLSCKTKEIFLAMKYYTCQLSNARMRFRQRKESKLWDILNKCIEKKWTMVKTEVGQGLGSKPSAQRRLFLKSNWTNMESIPEK